MTDSLPNIDPSTVDASAEVRQLVVDLLNVIEGLHADVSRLETQVLEQANELRILKGGNAVPVFPTQAPRNHSSGGREGGRTKKKRGQSRRKYPKLR